VTKEFSGIQITGFADYTINREGDGPFKWYKYMSQGNPNSNVKVMCESVVRHYLANHELKDVMTNRS
jgi:hypothetical protein